MQYQDFRIDIRSEKEDKFNARVVDAPFQDRPTISFRPPLGRADLTRFLDLTQEKPDHQGKRSLPKDAQHLSPRKVGASLYHAVFRDDLQELYLRCRAALPREEHIGLRLRLVFHLDDTEAGYLAALPWELLYNPKSGEYLANSILTPVARHLVNPHPLGALEVDGPLRILVVDAAPKTMEQLDFKLEIERMEEALCELSADGEVEILRLKEATPEAMRDALRDEGIHVLHFMGHGGYHEGSGMGAVYFVAPDGATDQVDGEMLGTLLKGIPELRLVVLNSCQTARHASRTGAPLYEGAASGIVDRTGMPAVVANQYSITDKAAMDFSGAFYRRLAARDPVDTAMSEARLRLSLRTPEWATPVLFLSSDNGRIFGHRSRPKRRSAVVVPGGQQSENAPYRVGFLSFASDQGGIWGEEMRKESHALIDFSKYFDPESPKGRFIRDLGWWQAKVFPDLRKRLLRIIDERRPLHLDLAAHQSIAFAAGWLLEAKSGLDVRIRQRTMGKPLDWHPDDDSEPEGQLWQARDDIELNEKGTDVALALSVSNPDVAEEVRSYIETSGLGVSRIIDASVPEPGQRSVKGGRHALRLAQTLVTRTRPRRPHERRGRLHIFGSAPNALMVYLGQLSRALDRVVLYEYAFDLPDRYGLYQRSIELPPPDEAVTLPPGWGR